MSSCIICANTDASERTKWYNGSISMYEDRKLYETQKLCPICTAAYAQPRNMYKAVAFDRVVYDRIVCHQWSHPTILDSKTDIFDVITDCAVTGPRGGATAYIERLPQLPSVTSSEYVYAGMTWHGVTPFAVQARDGVLMMVGGQWRYSLTRPAGYNKITMASHWCWRPYGLHRPVLPPTVVNIYSPIHHIKIDTDFKATRTYAYLHDCNYPDILMALIARKIQHPEIRWGRALMLFDQTEEIGAINIVSALLSRLLGDHHVVSTNLSTLHRTHFKHNLIVSINNMYGALDGHIKVIASFIVKPPPFNYYDVILNVRTRQLPPLDSLRPHYVSIKFNRFKVRGFEYWAAIMGELASFTVMSSAYWFFMNCKY